MKFFATLTVAVLLLLTVTAQPRKPRRAPAPQPPSAAAATPASLSVLPLRRVILYSNGVAYFERRGTVTGRAEINLAFKQSQVDDVLKSLLVLDLGKGRIGAVSYNSSAPANARLREIPFSIAAASQGNFGGMLSVLQQLQGAKVALTTATRTANGKRRITKL